VPIEQASTRWVSLALNPTYGTVVSPTFLLDLATTFGYALLALLLRQAADITLAVRDQQAPVLGQFAER